MAIIEEIAMNVVKKENYKKILRNTNLDFESKENMIDIYHKNNWDHFIMYWDERNRNDTPSYIDFFFDAKSMVCFLREFLAKENFKECYISASDRLKTFDDDVCKDIYDEFKSMVNSLGLKVNTKDAICMNKEEFVDWCDRFSVGGFSGVSEFSVLIPELNLLIKPYHHMNYLFYLNDKKRWMSKIRNTTHCDLFIK